MEWSDDPSTLHPFEQIVRECREEIAHEVDVDNLRLFGLGIDATKFYFQFSFLEYVDVAASEIIGRATTARDWLEMEALAAVPLEVGEVTRWAHGRTWEPSAGATFLSLCARELGNEELEWALSPDEVRRAWRDRVTNEWRRRATRVGESAVMSTRYPSDAIRWASGKYVEAVKDFIGDDLDGKDVLEIGAGNGRITEFLVQKVARLTCLDLSEDMLRRNRERLGDHHRDVQYVHDFAQNYRGHHDAVVSSLVLIHNVPRQAFNELVKMLHETAATLFLCEHADVGGRRTRHTRVRREEELLSAFSDYRVERRAEHDLFDDRVVLLKLRRG
jgi:SAM-dependent methyltransferase